MTPEKMAKLHSNSEANHRMWDAHEFAEILSSNGVLAECHEHGFALARAHPKQRFEWNAHVLCLIKTA